MLYSMHCRPVIASNSVVLFLRTFLTRGKFQQGTQDTRMLCCAAPERSILLGSQQCSRYMMLCYHKTIMQNTGNGAITARAICKTLPYGLKTVRPQACSKKVGANRAECAGGSLEIVLGCQLLHVGPGLKHVIQHLLCELVAVCPGFKVS